MTTALLLVFLFFVFSDYFTLVLPGNFEEASTLAMMKVLGIEEFHRGFDTIQESYNESVRSRPKILEGISKACETWLRAVEDVGAFITVSGPLIGHPHPFPNDISSRVKKALGLEFQNRPLWSEPIQYRP
jgi:hypothetical protein